MRASVVLIGSWPGFAAKKPQRHRVRLCFVFAVAVEDVSQSLWSDLRAAAHGSASGLRNRALRDDEAEVDR